MVGGILERNLILDLFKLILAFMVVGIHTKFLNEVSDLSEYLFVNGIFRIAVPMFFIINGFYFYSILSNGNQYVWFKRVSKLYLVWMSFYSYYWLEWEGISNFDLKLICTVFFGYDHLWYIPGLIGAAFTTLLLNSINIRFKIAFTITICIMGIFIQYIGNYHILEGTLFDRFFNIAWIYRNFLFVGFPFFYFGFLIKQYSFYEKVSEVKIKKFLLLGCALLLVESYFNYHNLEVLESFDVYFSLVFICPIFFMFLKKTKSKTKNKNLALYSSGVYFIHPFVIKIINSNAYFLGINITLVTVIVSMVICVFLIQINKRIISIL